MFAFIVFGVFLASRKDSKAVLDIRREEKLAKIPEEGEEDNETVEAELASVKEKSSVPKEADKKAVNGDVPQKEPVQDKYVGGPDLCKLLVLVKIWICHLFILSLIN